MKRQIYFSLPFFFYFFYGLVLYQFELAIFRGELGPASPTGYYDYRGVTHVHSDESTGTANFQEIIRSGREAGLDFLFVTDLNSFQSERPPSAYYGNLLFVEGGEYSYLDSHLLYYDRPSGTELTGIGQSQVVFSDLISQTRHPGDPGFIALAHPFQQGYQWAGPYPLGLDGIEIINLAAQWEKVRRQSPLSTAWSFLIYPFNPKLALFRLYQDPLEELNLWDQLNGNRHTIGLVGNDTSSKAFVFGTNPIQFPSYKVSFQVASNHVLLSSELTGEPIDDRRKILGALRSGQFYLCMDILANPKGFVAEIKSAKKSYPIGSRVKLSKGLELSINLPQKPRVPFETVVLKDGQRFLSSNSQKTSMDIHVPGVYRIMVRFIPTLPLPDGKRWFPWIYTNAFYVDP